MRSFLTHIALQRLSTVAIVKLNGATPLAQNSSWPQGRILPAAKITGRLGILEVSRSLLTVHLDSVVRRLAVVAPGTLVLLGILEG